MLPVPERVRERGRGKGRWEWGERERWRESREVIRRGGDICTGPGEALSFL